MATKKLQLKLYSAFHGTTVTIKAEPMDAGEVYVNPDVTDRAWKALCGMADCQCYAFEQASEQYAFSPYYDGGLLGVSRSL